MLKTVRNFVHTGLKDSLVGICRKKAGLKTMLEGVIFTLDHANDDRPHDKTLTRYDNAEIGGYAESLSPKDIENEPRFATVANYLKGKSGKVLDIGCASGDFIAYLKEKYGFDVEGIDFSVNIAKQKYRDIPFREGYFRDMDWQCDIAVFISTATCFTPKELEATIKLCGERGVGTIVFSEPFWWAQPLSTKSKKPHSTHAKYICWNHDYCGYLNTNGYETVHLERVKEKDNVDRILVVGQRAKS